MSFFNRLFNKSQEVVEPNVHFGRYSDIYKESERYVAWDKSLALFEEKKYLDAYEAFFKYLRDDEADNVFCRREEEKLTFHFYQGSKKITGEANRLKIKAEAKVVDAQNLQETDFFRTLLERNFDLEYCRFALDEDNNLTVIFDTSTLDGSPFKLYHALREMALQADKQDDLLLVQYPGLKTLNTGHTKDLPTSEKDIKYKHAKRLIEDILKKAENLKERLENYPGGISYLLLSLCYKLDYLLAPQGQVTDTLERIHRIWFANDKQTTEEKNAKIIKEFRALIELPQSEWYSEFYRVICTFGIVPAFGHDRVENIAEAELPVLDWYAEHNFPEVARAIADYIVGHSLFSFALPKPDRDLFSLYFRITESDFFKDLGFLPCCYDTQTGKFSPKEVKQQISRVISQNEENYLSLKPDTSLLKYGNITDFVRSYIQMVKTLELVQV